MIASKWPCGRVLLVGWLAAALLPGIARAQSSREVTGSAEIGWRSFAHRPDALELAKFEEYRDMSPGAYLESLRLRVTPGDSALTGYEFGARNALRRDQMYWARSTRPGLFDLRLGWDQVPHTYATDARNWAGSPSDFSLPTPRPDTAAWSALANSPYLPAIRNEWSVGRASLSLTPGDYTDLRIEFTRIDKSGRRPMGMSFGSPGSNQREILEPVDQTVNDLRISQGFARRTYQFQVSYNLNAFRNGHAFVTADNPLLGTSSPTAGSATGRSALAPGNLAQTLSLAGGVTLPGHTRVNTAFSLGWRSQNQAFIPMTINGAITDTRQNTMPRSLHGDVRTYQANVSMSSRLSRDVSVNGRYRFWRYDDGRIPEITAAEMPIEIINDRSISVLEEDETLRAAMPHERQNAGLELGWHPSRLANLKAGLAWEHWYRASTPGPRNVLRNNEYTPRLTLDLTPSDWLLVRGSLSRSTRRGTEYIEDMDRPELRRFDQADRDANRGDLAVELTPNDRVNLGLNWGRGREVFPTGVFGVRNDDNTMIGADLGWSPAARLNLFASYAREVFDLQQHSRYGEPSLPNNPTFDWIADTREWVETYGVGVNATLIPKKLDAEFRYDRSNGLSALHSRNPTTPTGGTASQVANATAVDFPDITHSWNPIRLAFRYQLTPAWAGTLGYTYERFDNNDFRTNALLRPFWNGRSTVDPVGDIILGNDLLPYRARFVTFTIRWQPRITSEPAPPLANWP